MFNFVVKYLGFLKAVPVLPFVFDGFLTLLSFITHPTLIRCLDDIETEVLSWEGTLKSTHKYGGIQFNLGRKEIGHIHGNGILDIRFSKKVKEQLLSAGKVNAHHVFKSSGWISFYIREAGDTTYALNLLRQSYLKISSPIIK